MTAVIAAFVSIGCIALGAFMSVRAQRRGERGQALAWYVLAFAGALGPITLIAAGVVAGLLLIAVAIWLLPDIVSSTRGAGPSPKRYGSYWGDQEVRYDAHGNPIWVGNDQVLPGADGRPAWIGSREVRYDSQGNIMFVGNDRVLNGDGGRPTYIGDSKVEP